MARPDASKARGIGAARWLALSGRTQHFVLDEGMDLGWRSGSKAQPGVGVQIHCWGQVSDDIWMSRWSARVSERGSRRQGAEFTHVASRALKIHHCTWRDREAICLRCVCDRV